MTIEARTILESCNSEGDFSRLSDDQKDILLKECEGNRLKTKNTFLDGSKNARFKIFDLPSRLTCPERTPICSKHCYQIKVEAMHKANNHDSAILCARKLNWFASLQENFVSKMIEELKRLRQKRKKTIYVRIHASGDFYSEEYLAKWMTIALTMKLIGKQYVFVAYTKSLSLLDAVLSDQSRLNDIADNAYKFANLERKSTMHNWQLEDFNLNILASVMDDTFNTYKKSQDIISKYHLPQYSVTKKQAADLVDCKKNTCAKCLKCYTFPMKTDKICTSLR